MCPRCAGGGHRVLLRFDLRQDVGFVRLHGLLAHSILDPSDDLLFGQFLVRRDCFAIEADGAIDGAVEAFIGGGATPMGGVDVAVSGLTVELGYAVSYHGCIV